MSLLNRALRPLRGANLEVFKFGMYLLFPIGWMYYFGTNLEDRFTVPDFWPTQAQSHTIPFERDDIRAEVERIQRDMRRRKTDEEARRGLVEAREAFAQTRREGRGRGGEDGVGGGVSG